MGKQPQAMLRARVREQEQRESEQQESEQQNKPEAGRQRFGVLLLWLFRQAVGLLEFEVVVVEEASSIAAPG